MTAPSDAAWPPGVTLREFTMEDYDAVFSLWENAAPGVEIRPSDARDQIALKQTRDPDLFLIAEVAEGAPDSRRIVGVVMGGWDGRRGWLHHLAVDRRYRRRGIASALLAEVEARLRHKGCLKVNLLVRAANEDARRLYRRLGYDEMPTIVVMGKEL